MNIKTQQELDLVTFEVLKNSFITAVDQMAEQMLRTCYSFVIYNRDFSNALHDAEGNCCGACGHVAFHLQGCDPRL
jgi:N-methylhydantoinase B